MNVLEKNKYIYYITNQMPSKARLNSFLGGFCVDFFFLKESKHHQRPAKWENNTGINVHTLSYFYFQFALFLK